MNSLQQLEPGTYAIEKVYPELNYLVLQINGQAYKANRTCLQILAGEDDAHTAILNVPGTKGKFVQDGSVVVFKKLKLNFRGKTHDLN